MRFLVATSLIAAACVYACGGNTTREKTSSTNKPGGGLNPVPTSPASPAAPGSPPGSPSPASGPDELESVSWATPAFQIFRYEATVVDGKAVSVAGQVPAVNIDYANAKAACEKGGYRLCKDTEWFTACKGKDKLKFGYAADDKGPPVVTEACDVARETNNTPGSLPSAGGSHPACVTKGTKIHDMVGNAAEWTVNDKNVPVAAGTAFYQPAEQSHCEQTLTGGTETMDPDTTSSDLGFRCCK